MVKSAQFISHTLRRGTADRSHQTNLMKLQFMSKRVQRQLQVLLTIILLLFFASAYAKEWYFRVGLGLEQATDSVFMDVDCEISEPTPLYGCGTGGDGAPLRSVGDYGVSPSLEVGVGYFIEPTLRLEALLEYNPKLSFRGNANFLSPTTRQSVAADLSKLTGMVALYADLPKLAMTSSKPVQPFLGAGIGAVHTKIGETHMTFPVTTTIVPGLSRTDFAWMISAGVATVFDEDTTLELAWRYTDFGEVRTGTGTGQVIWRDGSQEPRILNLSPTSARLRSHGLRISMRRTF